MMTSTSRIATAVAVVGLAAGPASAHFQLDFPPNRNDQSGGEVNKQGPCGGGASDPRDEARASTFEPGQTITVRWRETVGHTGRFRIAFAADGSSQADFNDDVLLDLSDPSGSTGNTANDNAWEGEITLPSTPCSNCTLQVVQVMNGDSDTPVTDPSQFSTYYQCADLVLGDGTPTVDEGATADDGATTDAAGCAATSPRGLSPALALALFLLGRRLRSRRNP